jgi:hypothetical protein
MTKEKLIETIQRIMQTDADFNFLLKLEEYELKRLVACIRESVEQVRK